MCTIFLDDKSVPNTKKLNGLTFTNQEWYSLSQSSKTGFSITAVLFTLSPNILWSCTKEDSMHNKLLKIQFLLPYFESEKSMEDKICNYYSYFLCYPFSTVLIDISSSRIQSLLHHTSLWKPARGGQWKKKMMRKYTLQTQKEKVTNKKGVNCHTWPILDG